MDKWIEGMENNAVKKLFPVGSLEQEIPYMDELRVDYSKGDNYVTLRGDFEISELEALITHMKKYTKE